MHEESDIKKEMIGSLRLGAADFSKRKGARE